MTKRLLITTLLVLASCGSSDTSQSVDTSLVPVETTAPATDLVALDDAYLATIKEMYPQEYEYLGSQSILDLGYMVCNSVDYGMNVDGIAKLSLEYGVDSGFLGAIFGAWIPSHCPENEAKFLNEPQSSTTQPSA